MMDDFTSRAIQIMAWNTDHKTFADVFYKIEYVLSPDEQRVYLRLIYPTSGMNRKVFKTQEYELDDIRAMSREEILRIKIGLVLEYLDSLF